MIENKTDNNLYRKNRTKLFSKLPDNSLVIFNSNDEMPRNGDQYFPYRQNSDLFYFTGINEPKTILVLCPQYHDNNYKEIVFVSKPNESYATWYGHQPNKEEITSISGVNKVLWLEDFDTVLKDLMINSKNIFLTENENIKFTQILMIEINVL